ncbi:hypothetical protein [Sulfuricurvum sp. RIFCSPLOWO2_12_FULL_43_24]|uniref:hypothetical protein n=1 Tax=Sulfuricurvum sp. RIFCSPLOWO2_12_FULL_43_24 TaxID=1802247 RepID=UPI0008BED801|nr:hypothetical protein [Sulfuricurvum sp. RIFCSPLOWO2_12_FULL_43_24]OHD82111.1 MAG: hypothetical protein A3D90_09670 [Sulfuricurvum sp. RIFCSPHIGHO2_02_FULL_43_9]OHD86431.1 MAG: hypothetical protein A3I60_02045 [Sulfuricurvum sp. RIFCSPLOWO2_02_FULL_43_45]OHD87316.1 MAG: hypothetical protein A2Y52_02335 [Sulfuricurvum sp. RIFCSPLOWO2_02_43_6]OHD92347.1 MAG: hypothetical protein A2W83_05545 [Sulfuricurvum sp. RIFCSPLOWO2_12_43_5]OHD88871.1 MAG: hypothetical protein A3G19_07445 [Sulfuricurvum s
MQELLSIQKYASKHHISTFNVIKKTMSGELPTVVKEENGKEVTYIVMNPSSSQPQSETNNTSSEEFEIDYKKAYEDLNKEYLILKTKYQKLVDMLEG